MSNQMVRFIWRMTRRNLWHKYNCFSLKDARKINSFLLWSILPSAMLCYALMYYILPAKAIDEQWLVYFITKATQFLFLSIISYSYFKDTRNAGMATAVMVYSGINFVAEMFGFTHKMFWFDAMVKLFFAAMALFIIRDIYNRRKNGGTIL